VSDGLTEGRYTVTALGEASSALSMLQAKCHN